MNLHQIPRQNPSPWPEFRPANEIENEEEEPALECECGSKRFSREITGWWSRNEYYEIGDMYSDYVDQDEETENINEWMCMDCGTVPEGELLQAIERRT